MCESKNAMSGTMAGPANRGEGKRVQVGNQPQNRKWGMRGLKASGERSKRLQLHSYESNVITKSQPLHPQVLTSLHEISPF